MTSEHNVKLKYISIISNLFVKYKKLIFVLVALTITTFQIYSPISEERSKEENMIYILQWTKANTIPFMYMKKGRTVFIMKNCSLQNCYVTSQKNYFKNMKDFDALVFYGPQISYIAKTHKTSTHLPETRTPSQSYIFVSIESSQNYPLCQYVYNHFFNWTWTYKLKSDLVFSYIVIRNRFGEVIGPKEEMHWIKSEDMLPVSDDVKDRLKTKSKISAWFVSNCCAANRRELFVDELQTELKQYGLEIDIYGDCGSHVCNVTDMKKCWEMIERDYYFYLAFENSFSEDYVTEKLLKPLQHYTVPIVYGSANYTRFMPDGIYLNALKLKLGVENLAKEMLAITKDPKKYQDFFKWHSYYSYHDPEEASDTDSYCGLCAFLNDVSGRKRKKQYSRFRTWWNEGLGVGACSEYNKERRCAQKP